MKTKNILALLILAATAFCSCQDGNWDATPYDADNLPVGNKELKETNVVSIADLKTMYASAVTQQSSCLKMDQEAQLKVYVTGNDISGNLSNTIAVADENGDPMLICMEESSIFGYLPVGQWILFETKDLYIGCYGSQVQIGTPYKKNDADNATPSRMPAFLWHQHFKLLNTPRKEVVPEAYTVSEFSSLDIAANAGKLMTLKNVKIQGAEEGKIWAEESKANNGNSVEEYFEGLSSSKALVYTSTYSKFAADTIPTKAMNLTGIWKRYNNKWELVIRDRNDIQVVE